MEDELKVRGIKWNSKVSTIIRFSMYGLSLLSLIIAYNTNYYLTGVQEIDLVYADLQKAAFHGILIAVLVIILDILYSFTKYKVLAILISIVVAIYSAFLAFESFHFHYRDIWLTVILVLFSLLFAVIAIISTVRLEKAGFTKEKSNFLIRIEESLLLKLVGHHFKGLHSDINE